MLQKLTLLFRHMHLNSSSNRLKKIAHKLNTNLELFNNHQLSHKNLSSFLKRHQSKYLIYNDSFSETINRAPTNYMNADLNKSETIKSKADELRSRYEAVQKERNRLREEISKL